MGGRSAVWFRNVALGGVGLALLSVPAINELVHGALPLWAHIPLTVLVLTLFGAGAAVADVAWVEFQARRS